MAVIQRPATLDEMVYQLWYAVIGSNGDGLASQVRKTSEEVEEIKQKLPTLWTREDHECAEKEYQAKDKAKEVERREHVERRKMSKREAIGLVIAVISTAAAVGATFVAMLALKGGS